MTLHPPWLWGLLLAAPVVGRAAPPANAHSRTFLFTYSVAVTGLEPGRPARVWLPVAQASDDQEASIVSKELPAEGKIGREAEYGNEFLYFEAKADADGRYL